MWAPTENTVEVTGAFKGLTVPVRELYAEIHKRGWEVTKVKFKKGVYEAEAKHPSSGEKITKTGPSDSAAVGHLLMAIVRKNFIRASQIRHIGGMGKDAAWGQGPAANSLEELAKEYAKAPIYDPKAAAYFVELGQDSTRRAQAIQQQIKVEVSDNPEPYETCQEMIEDIVQKHHFVVSRASSEHPVWSTATNIAFRIVHDVMGHAVSGGNFDWSGELRACAAHAPLLTATAQVALAVECVYQTAYASFFRAFGPQKVFVPKAFNPMGDTPEPGVHPSQMSVPVSMPSVSPFAQPDESMDKGYVAPHMEGLGLTPLYSRLKSSAVDPNAGWDSGVQPLPNAAAQWQNDPLGHQDSMDNAAKIDTGWANLAHPNGAPDLDSMRQAIVNAFRVVLLSPRKDLKWNAIHYQDISHIPATVEDPDRYWDALEDRRVAWNVARKYDADSHKPYFKLEKQYAMYRYQQELDDARAENREPLGLTQVQGIAKREVRNMLTDEMEKVEALDASQPEASQLSSNQIEAKAAANLAKRLQVVMNPKSGEGDEPNPGQMSLLGAALPATNLEGLPTGRYGAWMGAHLKGIAQISQHVNQILDAALQDVREHDGSGHHFRAAVLSLGVPGVGPKVCSFAWLLLQPMTSQLATIDTHMMDALGHNYEGEMNPRDYFKFERELAARRDAAGYGHMPLGAFQWSMWDNKRTGPGSHQDHSAMRVLNPIPHDQIDWAAKMPMAKGENYTPPSWWDETAPAGQQVADEYDQTIGRNYPRDAYPLQDESALVPVTAASKDEIFVAWQLPKSIRNEISNWASSFDWPEDHELEDPEDYHITVFYSPSGREESIEHIEDHLDEGHEFEITGIDFLTGGEGPDGAVVLRLKSPGASAAAYELMDKAEGKGADPNRFPGGYKAHITVSYGKELPKELTWEGPKKFRSEGMEIPPPRSSAVRNNSEPWYRDEEGNTITGQSGSSLMAHIRAGTGMSTYDVWHAGLEAGKT